MWICSRCKTANKDGYAQCVQCSAPKNARRFGAGGNPVQEPGVSLPVAERRMTPRETPEEVPSPRRHPLPPASKPRPFLKIARLVGSLLAVFLPLCVVLLAVWRFDSLFPLVQGFFFKPAPLGASPSSPILHYLVYGVTAFLVALLASVPGLSLLSLAHLARSVRPR